MRCPYSKTSTFTLALLLVCSPWATAYGPTGHLRTVWDNWHTTMRPHLKGTAVLDEDLLFAALAGSIVSDIGYVLPEEGAIFTDLVHYVRSGEFVSTLVEEAQKDPYNKDARLLAFALGFATHYCADRYGHYFATNSLVAQVTKAQVARLPYERDPDTHRWVETQLFISDLRDTPNTFVLSFLQAVRKMGGKPDDFLRLAYKLLTSVVSRVYPGAEPAFYASDLYRFLRFAAVTLCVLQETAARVYAIVPAPSSQTLCTDLHNSLKSDPAATSAVDKIVDSLGKSLPLEDSLVQDVYRISRDQVRENVGLTIETALTTRNLPNFNLDTNLPALGGQYACADSSFLNLMRQADGIRSPTEPQKEHLRSLRKSFASFQKRGKEVRRLLTESLRSLAQRLATSDSALKDVVDQLFRDISPLPCASSLRTENMTRCQSNVGLAYRIGDQTFLFDPPKGIVCFPERARTMEVLYGCLIARDVLSASLIEFPAVLEMLRTSREASVPKYLEALERLRLDKMVDSKSGLYPPSTQCPDKALMYNRFVPTVLPHLPPYPRIP